MSADMLASIDIREYLALKDRAALADELAEALRELIRCTPTPLNERLRAENMLARYDAERKQP